MNFNYNFYINKYSDLKNMSESEALYHWKNHGIKEGRLCNHPVINFETNITIIIHLFHEKLFDEFLKYINNVKTIFNLVSVLITIPLNSSLNLIINKKNPDFVILKVENKGTDNYPFIECIKYIRKNNIKTDYILKLHTKLSSNPSENYLNWRQELINPITNINNLYVLQHYFKNIKNIGFVGAQKCILPKNYDLDFPQNITGLNELCIKFPHLEKEWTDFVGGNIFWINNDVLNEYLTNDLIKYIEDNVSYGKPPENLTDKGIYLEYLLERLFTGIFCYNKTNILVNEYKGTQRGIGADNGIINNKYFYQPSVFSMYNPKNI